MDPFGTAVSPMFLFPNRNLLLQCIHNPLCRLERILAMGATDDHQHAGFTERHFAQAMDNHAGDQRPAMHRLGLQIRQLARCHLAIAIVNQSERLAAARKLARCAQKQHHRAGLIRLDVAQSGMRSDGMG